MLGLIIKSTSLSLFLKRYKRKSKQSKLIKLIKMIIKSSITF